MRLFGSGWNLGSDLRCQDDPVSPFSTIYLGRIHPERDLTDFKVDLDMTFYGLVVILICNILTHLGTSSIVCNPSGYVYHFGSNFEVCTHMGQTFCNNLLP